MQIPAHTYLGESATSPEALECLKRDLVSGDTVCEQDTRLLVWQALLLTENGQGFNENLVTQARQKARCTIERYKSVRPDEDFDPLSESDSWTSYYKDEELRAVIVLDCNRIFPEEPWFQGKHVQLCLQQCLFTWCKDNPEISYKQGMHEVAGVIIWVVLHGSKQDSAFIHEHALALFDTVMQQLKAFYAETKNGQSAILAHAVRIQSEILHAADHSLSARLTQLQIEPQLYCLKWLRLIFLREFQLSGVLRLWDALFAADPSLDLMDQIACAMLLQVRSDIMDGDSNTALTTLMRFPAAKVSPTILVQEAVSLRTSNERAQTRKLSNGHEGEKTVLQPRQPSSQSSATTPYTMHNLIEQADKLGINSYVWGAVEEVKRNVTPIINETRLLRHGSRDVTGSASTLSTSPGSISIGHRDRELAAYLALTISNLKNGDALEANIARLEDVKLVLQGRKDVADLSKHQSNGLRPASAPHTSMTFSSPQRTMSPIKIPAIKNKSSFNHETSAKVLGTSLADTSAEHKDDIPLSTSPKRSPEKVSTDFSYLFADEKSSGSTFNRSRKT